MPIAPVVVKLGGDAVHTPERIAAEAHRLARLAAREPVVAVVSARRGVTDHLLNLVEGVRSAVGGTRRPQPEADRAVATGEVVTAALLALALNQLGIEAVSLDAREAGVRAAGRFGSAWIHAVRTRRLESLLTRGAVPVVTGFQGWQRGRVATLGRGGTDTSAVAVAVALEASRAVFVKDSPGLRTADPRQVPDSRPIPRAPHRFLSALTAAGARVVRAEAAELAERHRLPLEFHALADDTPLSIVASGEAGRGVWAVASGTPVNGTAAVTVVAAEPRELEGLAKPLRHSLAQAGISPAAPEPAANGLRFLVPAGAVKEALNVLHDTAAQDRHARTAVPDVASGEAATLSDGLSAAS
jgi:aspartate kinase